MEKIDIEKFSYREIKGENDITHTVISENSSAKILAEKINEIIDKLTELSFTVGCPPHNMVDYKYVGNWGGSTPPPIKQCNKCFKMQ